jgi:hypothetical protein
MKLNLSVNTVVRSAVAAALLSGASVSAFALSVPTLPPTGPGPGSTSTTGGGLYVYAYDSANGKSFLEYLNLNYADFNKSTATPASGLTLDFGTLGSPSATWASFTAGSNLTDGSTTYAVFVAGPPGSAGTPSTTTFLLDTTLAPTSGTVTPTNLTNAGNTFNQLPSLCPSGLCVALSSGSPGYVGTALKTSDGANASSFVANGLIGTALTFYQYAKTGFTSTTKTAFSNAQGNGTWNLSAAGDLVYSIPAPSSVPLPAAVWLLGSGLLGLAGVGRRRSRLTTSA